MFPTLRNGDSCTHSVTAYGHRSTAWQVKIGRTMLKISVELDPPTSREYIAHALMLFVDPSEAQVDIPNRSDPGLWYFAPGVHWLGGQIPIPASIKQIYLAAGSYVHGGFITSSTGCSVRIHGRGILSGETFPFDTSLHSNFTWALLNMDNGSDHGVEGITLVDPPMYYFRSYAPGVSIRNVKLVSAWTFNTDGVVTGQNGLVEDCFIRANDDSVKLYDDGMRVRDSVVWQLKNGAVFQLGWWSVVDRQNISATNIDIIHTEWLEPGVSQASTNDAVLDCAPGGSRAYDTRYISLQNIRVEGFVYRLLNLVLNPGAVGGMRAINLENISVIDGGYIQEGTVSGNISDVRVSNLVVDGTCIESGLQMNLTTDVRDVKFSCNTN